MPPISSASLDVERILLGTLIGQSLPFPPNLLPSDFLEPKHQDMAAAILALEAKGTQVDEQTVSAFLRDQRSTTDAAYIAPICSDGLFSVYNQAWAAEVRKAATLLSIATTARRMEQLANDPATDIEQLLAYTDGTLKGINHRVTSSKPPTEGPRRMDPDELLSFNRKDDPNVVIGNRWLCKGGSMLIVGQSGTGKSSLMMQAAVHWCVGKDFFGIKPVRPLRAVILQAENDFGDVAEAFQDVVTGARLHIPELAQLKENLGIFRDTTSVGPSFPDMLKQLIKAHAADVIFVDPLLSFAGIDVSDQEQASRFLRHDLAPILLETGAILIAMHHTGKPKAAKDTENFTVADLAYSGLGSSEFTNYFREVAVLARCQGEEPIYKFGMTKRRGRAGLKDIDGEFQNEITIRHSREKGMIRWEYSTPPVQPDANSSPAKGSPRLPNIL